MTSAPTSAIRRSPRSQPLTRAARYVPVDPSVCRRAPDREAGGEGHEPCPTTRGLDVVVVGAGQAVVGVTIIWRGPAWLGWK